MAILFTLGLFWYFSAFHPVYTAVFLFCFVVVLGMILASGDSFNKLFWFDYEWRKREYKRIMNIDYEEGR